MSFQSSVLSFEEILLINIGTLLVFVLDLIFRMFLEGRGV
jgi:hypothetical protein